MLIIVDCSRNLGGEEEKDAQVESMPLERTKVRRSVLVSVSRAGEVCREV